MPELTSWLVVPWLVHSSYSEIVICPCAELFVNFVSKFCLSLGVSATFKIQSSSKIQINFFLLVRISVLPKCEKTEMFNHVEELPDTFDVLHGIFTSTLRTQNVFDMMIVKNNYYKLNRVLLISSLLISAGRKS